MAAMEEQRYRKLVDEAYRRISDAFEDVDGNEADLEPKGDVLTVRYRDGSRCVVNTQTPVRQIWLAGGGRAWHFDYDEPSGRWLDDKGSGADLFETIQRITRETVGAELTF